MDLLKKAVLGLCGLVGGRAAYDEYQGNSWLCGMTLIDRILSTVMAKPKPYRPTFPLPENAAYAGKLACDDKETDKKRRLFIAHMFAGSTKKTFDSHKQHLSKYSIDPDSDFVYCPPSLYLEYVRQTFPDCVEIGVQNTYPNYEGNFPGEVSLPMVKELGATYILLGPFHRRAFLGESNKFVADKLRLSLSNGMNVVIFLSNTTGDSDDCSTKDSVSSQIDALLQVVAADEWERVVFACEPPGTAPTTGEDPALQTDCAIEAAGKMCRVVRAKLFESVGKDVSQKVRILYSGEINEGSAPLFLSQPDIDGLVFCPRYDNECFINIINAGILVDIREERIREEKAREEKRKHDIILAQRQNQ